MSSIHIKSEAAEVAKREVEEITTLGAGESTQAVEAPQGAKDPRSQANCCYGLILSHYGHV